MSEQSLRHDTRNSVARTLSSNARMSSAHSLVWVQAPLARVKQDCKRLQVMRGRGQREKLQ